MVCDILCRMTFVIVCHKMTFMTDVILHKVSDDEDVNIVKADAQGNSIIEKPKKLKKVKDDTSDE